MGKKKYIRIYDYLLDKYFRAWFYFNLGRRPFDDIMGIVQQMSNVIVICVLLFGIDLKQYPFQLIIIGLLAISTYVIIGKFYKKLGLQKKEDYTNAKMSPVQKEILGHLRYLRKHTKNRKVFK